MEDRDINNYLEETYFCDCSNPNIVRIAEEYRSKYKDDKELAIKLFEFVRDKIKYRVGAWNKKASETLEEGKGMCTNSANLLVALLRASKIEAGYCIYKVIGGESFGHILPSMIKSGVHKDSIHIVTYVMLNNRWIKCDPATDNELSEKSSHVSNMTRLVIWDGVHDAVHPIDEKHIISVSEPIANIDYQMRKKPRYIVKNHVIKIGNLFIDFLRAEAHKLENKEQIEEQFHKWLKKNHGMEYYKYKFVSYAYKKYKNIVR